MTAVDFRQISVDCGGQKPSATSISSIKALVRWRKVSKSVSNGRR